MLEITGYIVTGKKWFWCFFYPPGAKVCCTASLARRPTRSGRTSRLSSTVNSPPSTGQSRRKTRSERHKKGSSLPEETTLYTAIDQVTLSVKHLCDNMFRKKSRKLIQFVLGSNSKTTYAVGGKTLRMGELNPLILVIVFDKRKIFSSFHVPLKMWE